jgi:hypothetical protein
MVGVSNHMCKLKSKKAGRREEKRRERESRAEGLSTKD